jgi:hypothetical protein
MYVGSWKLEGLAASLPENARSPRRPVPAFLVFASLKRARHVPQQI